MDLYEAVMTVEGIEYAHEQDEVRALQALINSGTWGLQGSFGRAMMDAIKAGLCALGPNPSLDYWGNRIPARHEVGAGTKGSVEYVEARSPFGEVLE
jgi:hypothetical protein